MLIWFWVFLCFFSSNLTNKNFCESFTKNFFFAVSLIFWNFKTKLWTLGPFYYFCRGVCVWDKLVDSLKMSLKNTFLNLHCSKSPKKVLRSWTFFLSVRSPHFIRFIHEPPPPHPTGSRHSVLHSWTCAPLPPCWPPRWSAVNSPPSPPSLRSSSSTCSSSLSEADCWSRLAAPCRLAEVRK